MIRKRIIVCEIYPDYSLIEVKRQNFGMIALFTDKEINFINKATETYSEAQEIIRLKYRAIKDKKK